MTVRIPESRDPAADRTQIEELLKRHHAALSQQLGQKSDSTSPRYFASVPPPVKKPFAFAIMPFNSTVVPIDVYEIAIKEAARLNKLRCYRVEEALLSDAFMNTVYSCICNCSIVIADLTGLRPNVMYELGIAHALSKPVTLLCSSKTSIPADLSHFNCIKYDPANISMLRKTVSKAMRQQLKQTKSKEE